MIEHVEQSIHYFKHGIEIGKAATLKSSSNIKYTML
jgi:hypothetical protein